MKKITILFLGFLIISGCQKRKISEQNNDTLKPNVTNETTNMETQYHKFEGNWKLVEWTAESTEGQLVHPFGEDAIGRISYDNNGNMAVQIMKNDRPQFLSEDPLQAQPDEVFGAYNGFIAYCGNYEVDLNSNQVVHQIKISSFPNWTGQNQIRNYEFKEDKLILSTDVIGSSRHKLIWKKIKN